MNRRINRTPKYVPFDDPAQVFSTYDLLCASALLCNGFELLSVDRTNPHKALFIFLKEDAIEEVVESYWSDRLEVKARKYADTIKALKNRLYSE